MQNMQQARPRFGKSKALNLILTYLGLSLIALAMLLPLLWLVSTAFKSPGEDIFQFPPRLFPVQPTFANFVKSGRPTHLAAICLTAVWWLA
jgi:ABC-type glycerol-3-phosphate transport system permease component